MIEAFLLILLVIIAMIQVYIIINIYQLNKTIPRLAGFGKELTKYPKVSVIVPIHNEAPKLEAALTSVCEQLYHQFEVIAVDDRSTDHSASIVKRLQSRYPHLKLISIAKLPSGWLGKTHALQRGLENSSGEYLIFTDADVVFDKNLLTKSVNYVIEHQLDHLTLAPYMQLDNLIIKIFMPFQIYSMLMSLRPWRMSDIDVEEAIGIGAFNLVNSQTMNSIRGFNLIRLNPLDDIGLAYQLRKIHAKQAFANPEKLLSIAWYGSLREATIGLEKNIPAFLDYSISKAALMFTGYLLYFYLPFIALVLLKSWFILIPMLMILGVVLSLKNIYKAFEIAPIYAVLYPMTAILPIYIGVRAVILCWYRGGIKWGSVFYPLKDLVDFQRKK